MDYNNKHIPLTEDISDLLTKSYERKIITSQQESTDEKENHYPIPLSENKEYIQNLPNIIKSIVSEISNHGISKGISIIKPTKEDLDAFIHNGSPLNIISYDLWKFNPNARINKDSSNYFIESINTIIDKENKSMKGTTKLAINGSWDGGAICLNKGLSNLPKSISKKEIREKQEMAGGLGSVAPVIGIRNTPYVVYYNKTMNPTFTKELAVQNDMVSKYAITRDKDGKLTTVDTNKEYEDSKDKKVYKYIGKHKGFDSVFESMMGQSVGKSFIFESLTGRPMLTEDQITYDPDFKEVSFEMAQQELSNDLYTILGKIDMINNDGLPTGDIVCNQESRYMLVGKNPNIVLLESAYGYYAMNRKTLRRTKYYKDLRDVCISEDLNNEKTF